MKILHIPSGELMTAMECIEFINDDISVMIAIDQRKHWSYPLWYGSLDSVFLDLHDNTLYLSNRCGEHAPMPSDQYAFIIEAL